MFTNFKKEFKKDKDLIIPMPFIHQINQELPEGLHYRDSGNGFLFADGDNEICIGGLTPLLTEKQKSILGNAPSIVDIVTYAKNSQEKIQFAPVKKGMVIFNGEEIPADKLVRNPYNPVKFSEGELFLIPEKLPENIVIKLGYKEYEVDVEVNQIPFPSVHTMKFESKENALLTTRFSVDSLNNTLSLNISIHASAIKSTKDIVKVLSIYNAFLKGEGLFNGQPIKEPLKEANKSMFPEKLIVFWDKVMALEDYLNCVFDPTLDAIDYDTAKTIEQLYQGLINNNPYIVKQRIESITRASSEIEDINNYVGKVLYFEFESTITFSAMNCAISLPALVGMFNSKLEKCIDKNGEQTLYFADASDEAKQYNVVKIFKNESEKEKYRKGNHQEIMQEFEKAKYIDDYL